jgi:hypothetical protein
VTVSESMERIVLKYFAIDDGEGRRFQTFKEIAQGLNSQTAWRELFVEEKGVPPEPSALKEILDHMVIDALLQTDWANPASDTYRITDHGLYESVVGLDALIEIEPSIEPVRVDAETWTGSRLIHIDSGQWTQIRITARHLQTVSRAINYQSEGDQKDVQGMADALVALCEMAEPDVSLIERILTHPKFRIYAAFVGGIATIRGALGI